MSGPSTTHITILTSACCAELTAGAGAVISVVPPAPVPSAPSGSSNLWWSTEDGQLYVWTGTEWVAASCCAEASGTVTSVGMIVPQGLMVGGSPITTNGILTLSWSGNIPNEVLPAPTTLALGGVASAIAPAGSFATGINTSGVLTFAQPAFSNISGNVALTQLPVINNNSVLGNVSGSAGTPTALTASQLTSIIPVFSTNQNGLVPAPGASTPATYVLQANGTWAAVSGGGGGTVTSVGMTVPSGLAVAGSPVTTNGTLAVTWSGTIPNAQVPPPTTAALGGVISSAAPANQFATGINTSGALTFAQPSFANLSGSATPAQLPAVSSTSAGIVPSYGSNPNNWVLTPAGWAAPGGSGTVTSVAATVPSGLAVSGSPITTSGTLGFTWSGTIPNAQVPAPTTSALGGVISSAAPANQFATGVNTSGVITYAQPSFANISGTLSTGQLPPGTGTVTSVGMTVPTGLAVSGSPVTTSGTLGVTWSGTIPNAQVPAPTTSALGGVISASAAANQFVTGVNTSGALTFAAAPTPALRMSTQIFTASGTYTPPAGLQWAVVECIGGGGGGGAITTNPNVTGGGGGGGSGGYSRRLLSAAQIGGSQTITIGAGGAGGSAGTGGNGQAGTASSMGSLVSANAGGGGAFMDGTGTNVGLPGNGAAVASITGQFSQPGAPGQWGNFTTIGASTTRAMSGQGAVGPFGGGGNSVGAGSGQSSAGLGGAPNTGGGGSGAVVNNSTGGTVVNGGTGGTGVCVVTEFAF